MNKKNYFINDVPAHRRGNRWSGWLAEPGMVHIPSQVQGGGLKSVTGRVIYMAK